MTYTETLDFLFSRLPAYHRLGKAAYKNNLDNTLALDEYFNHPHRRFKTIHVAGTNGKGSVSHMTASVLQGAGYKTGLYTSPHLKDFRERIKVNGSMISEEEVIMFVSEHRQIIEQLAPSFFELSVAMAFDFFARAGVDIAVIETGLGGRLDSTNIIVPELSVITNIGHDHMDLLGDTQAKVAFEKAGIIKAGVPVIIGESHPATKGVFVTSAGLCNSTISFADERFDCAMDAPVTITGERRYQIRNRLTCQLSEGITVLGGDYQSANIKDVFMVFEMLFDTYKITNLQVIDGIRNVVARTGLMGRWQVIGHDPVIICDTGHNKEGLEFVLNQLTRFNVPTLHLVIGFVNDKDLDSVLPLFPREARYYFTMASIERALDSELLKMKARPYGLDGESYADVKTALACATKNACSGDLIFVGGSTFVVGEVI